MKIQGTEARVIRSLTYIVFITISISCIYPMLLLVSISLTDMNSLFEHGFKLIPKVFSTKAYEYLIRDSHQVINAYLVTILTVVIAAPLSLLVISMLAYPLSRSDYKYNRVISFFIFFSMLFHGGLVPSYILISKYLHLKNTIWVLIIPSLFVGWYVILMKTFFKSIPLEVIESTKIDGASELKTYWNIVLPMSTPALATIGLFNVLRYWNEWFAPMLYIDNDKLITIQYLLYRALKNAEELAKNVMQGEQMDLSDFPTEPARMAMAVLASGPVLIVFPFFQKYFVKGLTIGAVKG